MGEWQFARKLGALDERRREVIGSQQSGDSKMSDLAESARSVAVAFRMDMACRNDNKNDGDEA